MVDQVSEAESSGNGVTYPYRRTEQCDKVHGYRCDVRVGVLGIDVSKENLVISKGRVRKYGNDREGYERIMEMRPEVVVLEPSGVYSVRPSQYFKERGVKVLQLSPNVLSREKDLRGKKTDFYDAEKLEHMVDEAREYVHNPLRESVSLYLFLKDVEVRFRNRLRRTLFLVSDDDGGLPGIDV